MRNVKTREGMEFWDKICALKHYGFINSPDNSRVLKAEGIGNWIDKFEAQGVVDQAQDEINRLRAERDALQQRLTAADQRIDELTIPDGYCIMPARLTAENGAKGLLLGEFQLSVTQDCPECADMEEPSELCSICDGEGEFGQRHTIPWDQIKFIYSKAVSGLAVQAPNHQSAPESVALDERTEFVKWVRREWPQAPLSNVRDLLPKSDPRYGEYCDETLQRAWVGWQARAALAGKF